MGAGPNRREIRITVNSLVPCRQQFYPSHNTAHGPRRAMLGMTSTLSARALTPSGIMNPNLHFAMLTLAAAPLQFFAFVFGNVVMAPAGELPEGASLSTLAVPVLELASANHCSMH